MSVPPLSVLPSSLTFCRSACPARPTASNVYWGRPHAPASSRIRLDAGLTAHRTKTLITTICFKTPTHAPPLASAKTWGAASCTSMEESAEEPASPRGNVSPTPLVLYR
ncbi:hypothetical protein OH77DRAFT_271379 [Trametes cingulata]|nr:hypothetical protein OH77DRAFT_271379 [Trametes cingulata]